MFALLKDIGFTDGEVRVYRALFTLGNTTIGPLSREARITPAKAYPVLEKLLRKGLIAKIKEGKTQRFQPNQPERLLTYLDERRLAIEEKRRAVERELPAFKALRPKEMLDVRILKGFGGLRAFYEEHNQLLLRGSKVFKVFSFEDEWQKDEVKRFIGKQDLIRRELGIEVRVIANRRIKSYIRRGEYKLVKMRFSQENLPVGTVISPEQIALMTWAQEPVIIVIDSAAIGRAYERFFDDVWSRAK